MSCFYILHGKIPLKQGVPQAAIDELLDTLIGDTDVEIGRNGDPDMLVIDVRDGMSYASIVTVDTVVIHFAKQWASAGAVLYCEVDGEAGELVVGPNYHMKYDAQIEHISQQIEALRESKDALSISYLKRVKGVLPHDD